MTGWRRQRRLLSVLMLVAAACGASAAVASGIEAREGFERLKGLEGTWRAEPGEASDKGDPAVFEVEVSANGSVVQETMFPGSAHEMINMYHMDGDDLMLTHYCSSGNQPRMRLDRGASSADLLVFDFDGGTNLDPAVDVHIHAARLTLRPDGRLESSWTGYSGGVEAGVQTWVLQRDED